MLFAPVQKYHKTCQTLSCYRYYGLIPIAAEDYSGYEARTYYAVAVARRTDSHLTIFNLKSMYLKCVNFMYDFLAHLVYQPKSLIQSCFVHRHCCCHPASALASSVHTSHSAQLNIESSYLVHRCIFVHHTCTSNIQ